MLRSLFVTSSLTYGGAERHAVTVMNRLAERGHEVHAIYLKDDRPNQLERLRLRGGSVGCMKAEGYLDLRAVREFAGRLAEIRPLVIVAANPYALMYAWIARRRAGIRAALVVTYHSTLLLDTKECLQMLAYRLFFWSSDCLVFVCERQRRHWLRRAVFARRTDVIYNGVDTDEYCDRTSPGMREQLRRRCGFEESDYVIGISAWLRPEKNHVQLVDAVALLRQRGIPARVLMIGEGEMRPAIEARARVLGVAGAVVITGFRADVRPFIAASDVVVLCSKTVETFSLAALEAMSLARPVVLSDIGGAAEMIQSGLEGFLFPVGNTHALAECLSILADRRLSVSMGARARVTVKTRFSERAMVDRYEDLLRDIARSGGRAV